MKKILIFSVLTLTFLIFLGCNVQKDPIVAMQEKAEMDFLHQEAIKAIEEKNFVLEADYIVFKRGYTTYVNSNTNFISLFGDKATIQLAFNSPYAGPNGIGGITVEGTVSNIKIDRNKKGHIIFNMSVMGRGVSAQVTLDMPEGTNQCSVTVSPNFNSNRITFAGSLYSKENSRVFKGRVL